MIPIIDIFAGPGGLGEGFSSLLNPAGKRVFKIALSIEKDRYAHQTLTLRSFFRQFEPSKAPKDYYEFVKGNISLEELYKRYPVEAGHATNETWLATLGESKDAVSSNLVDKKIYEALNGERNWLLIGGPPCQAYSVVGRVRRKQNILDESTDERVGLYKQYLRILAVHNPAVFVMENVKGLLSATTEKSPVFTKILKDLANPVTAYLKDYKRNGQELACPGYKIFSLVVNPKDFGADGEPIIQQKDFLIRSENYGIPQTRHRVILLGVRNDISFIPGVLEEQTQVAISKVLSGLTKLRGKPSRGDDSGEKWKDFVNGIMKRGILTGIQAEIKHEIVKSLSLLKLPDEGSGKEFIADQKLNTEYRADWFIDNRLGGVCNHAARGHMESDLHRYFFISCFANIKGYSPQLSDFPLALLPDHKNVYSNDGRITRKFADRFRVQLKNKPSKTITSHISQDGHYYIHYDPTQCRSFTVREAARIQTFPDNYFFCGPRTSQFIQVGNAVPPLLANQIAEIVFNVFSAVGMSKKAKKLLREYTL
ncbi:DNA (cytosine-5)-methyltransferase 1 [Arcticibacter tournemirensis]|uniref:DNA (cytosine-5-)-methyltransferase n=1 Tax=Arcticibacter tournemirensis TaxID=699437 RepID=A0A5M9GU05_9SPHI|nr:DNA (cytosine-5-)-methyltransferase [Arcticibacter tournemirensis]KAA8478213.1 DNA cytosine methyltransferase [Arcticibacter tournemirensis]TQM50762.1 DNA (cytosine-5)-methyltransferase 1 [Arcticibacter tournemirensis]